MPEYLRDDLGVNPLQQEKRCRRVPQVVEPDQRQPGALKNRHVLMARHVDPDQWLPKLVAEDQVAVAPRPATRQLFELLARANLPQCPSCQRRHAPPSAAVVRSLGVGAAKTLPPPHR